MNYINKIKTLLNFIKYTNKGFSPCKIYQTLEFKKLKIERCSNYKKINE